MADKTRVRVTIEPDVVREVDDAELTDLHRQGILHSWETPKEKRDGWPLVGVEKPNRWRGPDRGDEVVEAPAPTTAPDTTTKEG